MATKLERLREILQGVLREWDDEKGIYCTGCDGSEMDFRKPLSHWDDCAWPRIDAILAEPAEPCDSPRCDSWCREGRSES